MKKVTLELDQVQYQILCDALGEFQHSRVGYYEPGTPGFQEAVESYVLNRYPTFNDAWKTKKVIQVSERIATCKTMYEQIVHTWHEEGN